MNTSFILARIICTSLLVTLLFFGITACGGSESKNPPEVGTNSATGVSAGSASLNGNINPKGEFSQAYFYWGGTPQLLYEKRDQSAVVYAGSDNSGIDVTYRLENLAPGSTYYFQAAASRDSVTGRIRSFTTLDSPESYWIRTYGVGNAQEGTFRSREGFTSVSDTDDGNHLVIGFKSGDLGRNLWIVKFDINWRVVFEYEFTGYENLEATQLRSIEGRELIRLADNNLLIAGQYAGYPWLAKVNQTGHIVWQKRLQLKGDIRFVYETPGGGLAAIGNYTNSDSTILGTGVLAFDSEGDLVSARILDNGSGWSSPKVVKNNDKLLLIGTNFDDWILSIDPAGTILNEVSSSCFFDLFDLKVSSSGEVMVAGEYVGNPAKAFVAKTDDNLNLQWAKLFGEATRGAIYENINFLEDDRSVILTTGSGFFGFGTGVGEINDEGDLLWAKSINTRTVSDHSMKLPDNDFLLLGSFLGQSGRECTYEGYLSRLPHDFDLGGNSTDIVVPTEDLICNSSATNNFSLHTVSDSTIDTFATRGTTYSTALQYWSM